MVDSWWSSIQVWRVKSSGTFEFSQENEQYLEDNNKSSSLDWIYSNISSLGSPTNWPKDQVRIRWQNQYNEWEIVSQLFHEAVERMSDSMRKVSTHCQEGP